MNRRNLYYYLGILLLVLGSISLYTIAIYWLCIILALTGITFITMSDKKTWEKIVTILLIPILSVIFLIIVFIALAGDNTF